MTRDDLIRQIEQARFRPVRGVQGYDMAEVDSLLDALVLAVGSGMPVADIVGRARFSPVRLREGYATSEVDDFLRQLVDHVHGLEERAPYAPPVAPQGAANSSPLGRRITEHRFTTVRLREGYDMNEVDQLLDELAAAADAGAALRTLAGEARFTRVRLREGYDMAEVDAFLRDVVAEAEGARPGAAAPSPAPSVIQEQRGLLGRLFGGR